MSRPIVLFALNWSGNDDLLWLDFDLSDYLQVDALHHRQPQDVHAAQNREKEHIECQPRVEMRPALRKTVACNTVDDLREAVESQIGKDELA